MSSKSSPQAGLHSLDTADRPHPTPSRTRSTALQLAPDWQRILRDISTCGTIHSRIDNGSVSLQTVFEPASARIDDRAACLAGPGIALAGLTEHWAHAGISRSCRGGRLDRLDILDHHGVHLLRVSLTEDSAWQRFNPLLTRQWAGRWHPASLPDAGQLPRRLSQLQRVAAPDTAAPLQQSWYDAVHPARPGCAIDTSLLPPFLETLGDQVLPLEVLAGNRGLLQRQVTALYDFRQAGPVLRLRNRSSQIEIDSDRVCAAYIVDPVQPAGDRWLHLYDHQQHCVAAFGIAADADPADRQLWQTLLRALSD